MKPFIGITKKSSRLSTKGSSKKRESRKKRRENCRRWENSKRKLLIDNLKLTLWGPREHKKNRRETPESENCSSNRRELDSWLTLIKLGPNNSRNVRDSLLSKQKLKSLNSWESSKIKNLKKKEKRGLSKRVKTLSWLTKRTWDCKSCRTQMQRSRVGWTTLKKEDSLELPKLTRSSNLRPSRRINWMSWKDTVSTTSTWESFLDTKSLSELHIYQENGF